jgi:hypothetical protein
MLIFSIDAKVSFDWATPSFSPAAKAGLTIRRVKRAIIVRATLKKFRIGIK